MNVRFAFSVLFATLLFSLAYAVPPGVGTITQLIDVEFESTVYIGKTYYISAKALDVGDNPIKDYSCAIRVKETITDIPVYRLQLKHYCKTYLTSLPTEDAPFACYYTTFGDGSIIMPIFIDPGIFEPNTSYTASLICGSIEATKIMTVQGVSDSSCNVSGIKIHDGTDGTNDFFDEAPNKFEELIVPFELESNNTICNGKKVSYKIQKRIGSGFIDTTTYKEHVVDLNGTSSISILLDSKFVTDGIYKVIVASDNEIDSAEFVVNIPRVPYNAADISFFRQETVAAFMLIFIVLFFVIVIVLKSAVFGR